jgi:hypothetical protein
MADRPRYGTISIPDAAAFSVTYPRFDIENQFDECFTVFALAKRSSCQHSPILVDFDGLILPGRFDKSFQVCGMGIAKRSKSLADVDKN